jgi:hypothetical protein
MLTSSSSLPSVETTAIRNRVIFEARLDICSVGNLVGREFSETIDYELTSRVFPVGNRTQTTPGPAKSSIE